MLAEGWRGGELSPAATSGTLLLPHPLGRHTGENCLSKFRIIDPPELSRIRCWALGALAVQVIWGLCWVASRTLGTLDQR